MLRLFLILFLAATLIYCGKKQPTGELPGPDPRRGKELIICREEPPFDDQWREEWLDECVRSHYQRREIDEFFENRRRPTL